MARKGHNIARFNPIDHRFLTAMSDLNSCTMDELTDIIRAVVVTNPWSTVNKFPDMKKITVIRSDGFTDSKGHLAKAPAETEPMTEEETFQSKLEEMKDKGLRLVTGWRLNIQRCCSPPHDCFPTNFST